ncbi:MAG: 5-formyltetrahydrofolate cyclo-ligase [Thermodesulfovibrio sp.]|uniref:5-formyltetrahydrofolate cyclo-ligase n=1 Tax=Thermodesulfovibrio sp. 1176 TaxID=3043424 RepID=UPI0024829EF1|nr:5-formyltetrahydrofolate cyclo-ligase [Thermodesulfovibrio sp. 1176]MDI1472324.1 5-formyltetrahydrofolate cyclo-ligase [Thermodesulfovibrio sp. 1176]MDI6714189.1 5-formyltetrahydrofolate cyclo-ligase [Thermodesulfovibrio sp.]
MKRVLRKRMIEIRNNIEITKKKQKDEKIASKFLDFLENNSFKSVLLYASFGSEVDTWKIFELCKKLSIKTAFPKVNEKDKSLDLYWIESLKELSEGYKSILEPCTEKKASLNDIEVIVVPGLAFDRNCYRIGYGGGYYDKLLSKKTGLAVGLAYEEQIINEIPIDKHDKKLDFIITDERVINCV